MGVSFLCSGNGVSRLKSALLSKSSLTRWNRVQSQYTLGTKNFPCGQWLGALRTGALNERLGGFQVNILPTPGVPGDCLPDLLRVTNQEGIGQDLARGQPTVLPSRVAFPFSVCCVIGGPNAASGRAAVASGPQS